MKIIGQILDAKTSETLPGVHVFISDREGKIPSNPVGTVSDIDGNYVIDADAFDYITFAFVGYSMQTKLAADLQQDPYVLMRSDLSLPEIQIFGGVSKKLIWPQVVIYFGIFLFLIFIYLRYIKES